MACTGSFDAAPEGFEQQDVMPERELAVALGCRFLVVVRMCTDYITYTRARKPTGASVDGMAGTARRAGTPWRSMCAGAGD